MRNKSQVDAEIDAMQRVNHKNVIRLVDVVYDAEYPARSGPIDVMLVVLEIATGGEFFDFLSYTGKFDEAIARTYFHQLIDGLEACHSQGVAHRDIKPENLLLDDKFVLKLADFGFAKVLHDEFDLMRTECGTRGYMAPEILQHNAYSMSTDIFAAGVVLFIMLAGFPPFQLATAQDWWYHKVLTGRTHLFWQAHCRSAHFSDPAKDFILRILSPIPDQRLSLDEIRAHEWFSGDTLSDDELYANLSRRKNVVDEQKEAERRQRQVVTIDEAHERGFGDDELPTETPDLTQFVRPGDSADDQTIDELLSGQISPISMGASPRADDPELPKPAEYIDALGGWTQFYTASPARNVIKRLSYAVRVLHGQVSIDEPTYQMKVKLIDEVGTIEFVAQVFSHPRHDLNIVVFRRRQGDPLEYRKLYDTIYGQIGDLSVSDPVA